MSRVVGPRVFVVASALLLRVAGSSTALAEEPAGSLHERALSVLEERCAKCHSEKRQKGELRLDSLEHAIVGGESGTALVPGKPDESLLVVAVRYEDEDLRMPPKGKLDDAEIATLVEWVRQLRVDARAIVEAADEGSELSAEDRAWWAFQPLVEEAPPSSGATEASPIDAFVSTRLQEAGVEPAPRADRRTLIRRLSFDLTGLPPSPEDVEEFVADESPEAWEKVVDRLLASPRFGERQGRHWLDLVRYAESNGYRADEYRPLMWRYRDWVVASLNDDKPYDRFLAEQVAGDELWPEDPEALTATGYLRLWPYESNQKNVRGQWRDIINDVTDVSGEVFLALSLRCARCHDHKFDPIPQEDYFRLRAFFAPILPREDLVAATTEELAAHRRASLEWREKTAAIRDEIAAIERDPWRQACESKIPRFPETLQPFLRRSYEELPPLEQQLHHLASWQIAKEAGEVAKIVRGDAKKRREELLEQLVSFDSLRPAPLPRILGVSDVGPEPPENRIPGDRRGRDIGPGFPAVLSSDATSEPSSASIATETRTVALPTVDADAAEARATSLRSTGRRAALARWLAGDEQPLVPRVAVNRIWQRHFGEGIVATANDFGRQGTRPTHPRLLDWLARRFVASGWSAKAIHREVLLSETWRRASVPIERSEGGAPSDDLLWRRRPRRLDAESLRDALLAASGDIDVRVGGAGGDHGSRRRSVYVKVLRNTRPPMMASFDGPDGFNSCARRDVTTTAPQALLLLNGEWTLDRARSLAGLVEGAHPEEASAQVALLYRRALGRSPEAEEIDAALAFLDEQRRLVIAEAGVSGEDAGRAALVDLAHVLVNSNEFLYVD